MNGELSGYIKEITNKRHSAIQIVNDGEIDYYKLCKWLKEEELFEYMMVDLEKPDGAKEDIKTEYRIAIESYLNVVFNKAALIAKDIDAIYFGSITLVYLCFSIYPGGNNKYTDNEYFISLDELLNIIIEYCSKYQEQLTVSHDTIKRLCTFMYHLLNHGYYIDLEDKLKILEKCDNTWVEALLKIFTYSEAMYDGLAQLKYYIDLSNDESRNPDSQFLILYGYLEVLPKSLVEYLWDFSDQLADHEAKVGFQRDEKFLVLDSTYGNLLPEDDAHIIPMFIPYTEIVERDNYDIYNFFRRYRFYAGYYNDLISEINKKYGLDLQKGKESFENTLLSLNPKIGNDIIKYIFYLENSDTNSRFTVPYRVRSYFYSAEALFILIQNMDVELELELSFMCTNYIKGMEALLADSIQYILRDQNRRFVTLDNLKYDNLQRYACGELLFLITNNREMFTIDPNAWGTVINNRLDGFVGELNKEWVQKIRNGKMHKAPVLQNYPIDHAPQGVRISTYNYLIEILNKLKISF